MDKKSFGKNITPVLKELEMALWERESLTNDPIYFPDGALQAATKIFMSVIMDKMWEMQESENMPFDDRVKMGQSTGREIKKVIHTATNIDTFKFYDDGE